MGVIVCILIGYFLGCLLTAEFVTRKRLGESAFDVGTGNPGMANIGSLLGPRYAAIVLAGDILKVILAVLLANLVCGLLYPTSTMTQALLPSLLPFGFPHSGTLATLYAGLGATIGHNFPFWNRFSGGKGVTTTCATIVLLEPLMGVISCLIGLLVVIITRQLCAGAIVIPVVFELAIFFTGAGEEFLMISFVLIVLMLIKHTGAVIRALRGEEPETILFGRDRED